MKHSEPDSRKHQKQTCKPGLSQKPVVVCLLLAQGYPDPAGPKWVRLLRSTGRATAAPTDSRPGRV